MTQADFAKRIGVSQRYLSAVEHGGNEVGVEVLLALGREFSRWLKWLLTGEEEASLRSVLN
jgi:transcriptional regulator with XRE-family HTH domain